jgi:hypothetical protein
MPLEQSKYQEYAAHGSLLVGDLGTALMVMRLIQIPQSLTLVWREREHEFARARTKGMSINNSVNSSFCEGFVPRGNRGVPAAVASEVEAATSASETLTPLGYLFSSSPPCTIGCGRGNHLEHSAIAAQRLAAPIDGDEREEAMLDFIPFAGAGQQIQTVIGSLISAANF